LSTQPKRKDLKTHTNKYTLNNYCAISGSPQMAQ